MTEQQVSVEGLVVSKTEGIYLAGHHEFVQDVVRRFSVPSCIF